MEKPLGMDGKPFAPMESMPPEHIAEILKNAQERDFAAARALGKDLSAEQLVAAERRDTERKKYLEQFAEKEKMADQERTASQAN